MIDVAKIRDDNPIMDVVGGRLKRKSGTKGGEWHGPCPFHGGTDGFHVQPFFQGGRFFCRKCTNGEWRDVITFVMMRDHKSFVDICELLGAPRIDREDFKPAAPYVPVLETPNAKWQMAAARKYPTFERELWARGGETALGWLHDRGLRDQTIKKAHIGFNPTELHEPLDTWGFPEETDEKGRVKTVYIPRGVVMPGIVRGLSFYLKVRRSSGKPKYLHVRGSKPALYLLHNKMLPITALVEGEFDALLLQQEAGDLVSVVTLGSAYNGLDLWKQHLKRGRLLVAYHGDEAGQINSAKIAKLFPHAEFAEIPRRGPDDKDLTDYYRAGGNLREWIKRITNETKEANHR